MKGFVENNNGIIQWISGLGLPVAILLSSWLVSTTVESSKLDTEYVKIAIGILSTENKDDKQLSPENEAMRSWAIRVLDSKSPVKLNDEEKLAFINKGLNIFDMIELQLRLKLLEKKNDINLFDSPIDLNRENELHANN